MVPFTKEEREEMRRADAEIEEDPGIQMEIKD